MTTAGDGNRAWLACVRLMRRQHGIARRDQLIGLGLGPRLLRRRLATGLLDEVNPSVVALPATIQDHLLATRAAVLARPDVIPTGPSSAVLLGRGPWEEVRPSGEPWLIGPRDRSLKARFVTHPDVGTVRREGLVVAGPEATVIDLLRFLPKTDAARVGRAALQQGVVDIQTLELARARLSGLKGMLASRDVIAELREGTHSEAEHELMFLVRRAGLQGWRTNHGVAIDGRRYYIDLAFPDAMIAVEVDGRAHHSDARAFRRDRRRQNDLQRAGWRLLRFTWEDLMEHPEHVIGHIVEALEWRAVHEAGQ